MYHYQFHEGSLALPEGWRDESMNIFKAPEEEGYNLVISRERIPRSVKPDEHLAAQRKIIEENLANFREVERRTIDLDGEACVWLEYSWKSPEGPMYQVNVMRVAGPILVSFTFTAAKPLADGQRACFREVLSSYKFAAHLARPAA